MKFCLRNHPTFYFFFEEFYSHVIQPAELLVTQIDSGADFDNKLTSEKKADDAEELQKLETSYIAKIITADEFLEKASRFFGKWKKSDIKEKWEVNSTQILDNIEMQPREVFEELNAYLHDIDVQEEQMYDPTDDTLAGILDPDPPVNTHADKLQCCVHCHTPVRDMSDWYTSAVCDHGTFCFVCIETKINTSCQVCKAKMTNFKPLHFECVYLTAEELARISADRLLPVPDELPTFSPEADQRVADNRQRMAQSMFNHRHREPPLPNPYFDSVRDEFYEDAILDSEPPPSQSSQNSAPGSSSGGGKGILLIIKKLIA
jgi:hypothetical protein